MAAYFSAREVAAPCERPSATMWKKGRSASGSTSTHSSPRSMRMPSRVLGLEGQRGQRSEGRHRRDGMALLVGAKHRLAGAIDDDAQVHAQGGRDGANAPQVLAQVLSVGAARQIVPRGRVEGQDVAAQA